MADQSLLSDELRSYIGRASTPRTVRVNGDAVQRAVGVYGGDEERSFAEGDVVPGYVLSGLVPESEEVRVPEPLPKSLLVSNEFSIERPIRFGEEFIATSRVADINERLGGQFGHGLYVRTEIEYASAEGETVGRTASTLMYYDPAGRRGEGAR